MKRAPPLTTGTKPLQPDLEPLSKLSIDARGNIVGLMTGENLPDLGIGPLPRISGTARAPPRYSRHRPEDTVLYVIVEQNAERFFEQL